MDRVAGVEPGHGRMMRSRLFFRETQIVHRWNQEGRPPGTGQWFATVRLVKVNRSPITRERTAEGEHMSGDKAIWIESADSVGFTCTAFIDEKDAATFLYWYPSGRLATVMDGEVRERIQQRGPLRAKKKEIVDAVKLDITTFFTTPLIDGSAAVCCTRAI